MSINLIKREQTLKLIDRLPSSHCSGNDDITNDIIKKIKYKIEPIITHLINQVIITEIYPDIYKLDRILPLSKPDKCKENIESYRPINNLNTIGKIIDQYFQDCLVEFLNDNEILNNNHHGGRKGFSTQVAISQIYNNIFYNKEKGITSVL